MNLENIYIYEHIKDYLDEIEIVKYKKGDYITHSNQNLQEIFFILDGNVKVEYTTKNGRSFLVDDLWENEFVGKISYMYDENLFCDIIAKTEVLLLKISKSTLKKLEKNPEFLKIFFFKTSKRIYCIYKKLLMKDLFTLEEIIAFHILNNCNNDKFEYKSMYSLCKSLSVSRKGLYNVINKFIKKGYIKKDRNLVTILEKEYLHKISMYIREFNEVEKNDFKFNI
jgi:CRP-like cAMP-binding protein